MTDANLLLGRLLPQYFPKIFGPKEDEPLDYSATKKEFETLTAEVCSYSIYKIIVQKYYVSRLFFQRKSVYKNRIILGMHINIMYNYFFFFR